MQHKKLAEKLIFLVKIRCGQIWQRNYLKTEIDKSQRTEICEPSRRLASTTGVGSSFLPLECLSYLHATSFYLTFSHAIICRYLSTNHTNCTENNSETCIYINESNHIYMCAHVCGYGCVCVCRELAVIILLLYYFTTVIYCV